jgi:phosphate transport system substrate-binding protein
MVLPLLFRQISNLKKINLLQLQEIFSGDISDWSQVSNSGLSGEIKICAREKGSGTNESFKAMVMNGKGITSNAKVFTKNEELVRTVINSDNAIGFVSFNSVSSAKVLGIQEDANTEPLYPTAFTIATEDYPLCRRLYFYAPAASTEAGKNEHLREFISFALSEEGQKVVGKSGFVELDLQTGGEETLAELNLVDIPAEYTQATQGAKRERLDFRFQTGTSKLDNKAVDDIDRLIKLFAQAEYRKKQIILLGFTDDQGADDANRKLAQSRVEEVAAELSQRGLKVTQKKGLGEIVPVASNVTPLGREKNRRVEVWIK